MEITKSALEAPCKKSCPVNIDVPGYIRAISMGKFDAALNIVREKLPFPSICGRVCISPCETNCNCNHLLIKGPVAIRELKRFVAERPDAVIREQPSLKHTDKKIAIVGAGPCGLTAAYYLQKQGHSVTVFEMLNDPGGLMRYAIPDYRLPRDIIAKEIGLITDTGVSIKTNVQVESPAKLFEDGYNAIFWAIGASEKAHLGIQGEDLPGVIDSSNFLMDIKEGEQIKLGESVAIIGGGNSAIDAARSALRLGSKEVVIYYRRRLEDMPAHKSDIKETIEEGIRIEVLVLPIKIAKHNAKLLVHFLRTKTGGVDSGGRHSFEPITGSEFTVEVDNLISAIGLIPQNSFENNQIINQTGSSRVIQYRFKGNGGLFAGGDMISGATSVIDAIASGREAAVLVDKHLGGNGDIEIKKSHDEGERPQFDLQGFPVNEQTRSSRLSVQARVNNFSPIDLGYDEQQAMTESKRCLKCDLPISVVANNCTGCMICVMRCSARSGKGFSPAAAKVSIIPYTDGKLNEITFSKDCDSCGICARYCPNGAIIR